LLLLSPLLLVAGCFVSGSLPELNGEVTSLERLLVSENHLEGPLPDVLTVAAAAAASCLVSGSLPESYGEMTSLERPLVSENHLEGRCLMFLLLPLLLLLLLPAVSSQVHCQNHTAS
jgi:hypothetical protein